MQRQLQQQQQQFAADLEAIDDDLRERLYELDKKKPRGSKAGGSVMKTVYSHFSLAIFTRCWSTYQSTLGKKKETLSLLNLMEPGLVFVGWLTSISVFARLRGL